MATPGGITASVVVKSNRVGLLPPAIHQLAVAEVERAGREIQAAAQQKAAVRTGTLRRSITTQITDGGLTARVGPSVEYGKYVEFGARGRGPRPYLRPAFELVAPRFVDRMKAALRGLP